MTKAFLVYPGFDIDAEWGKTLQHFHRQIVGHAIAVLTGTLAPKTPRDGVGAMFLPASRAKPISEALQTIDIEARTVDCRKPDWHTIVRNFEAVFLDVQGEYGVDGTLQGFLDICGIPYTGPRARERAIAYDRSAFKAFLCS